MKIYKLMIKQHKVTGLKYLCITCKENWERYTGSGRHWKNHIKKHGSYFDTELLYESGDYDDFVKVCIFFSDFYDVVKNKEFANAIPESGYDNNGGKSNFEIFWETATNEIKEEIYKRRRDSLVNDGNHWAHSEERRSYTGRLISGSLKSRWGNLTKEEREIFHSTYFCSYELLSDEQRSVILNNLAIAREKSAKFFEDKDSERYKFFVELKRQQTIETFKNMNEQEKIERSEKISNGRLSMTEEAKKLRGERVGESFKRSEKRQQFNADMKVKRIGSGNPNAKIVVWMGVEMTKGEFERLGVDSSLAEEMFTTRQDCIPADPPRQDYKPLTCPYCGKDSGNKKHSAFKRWHFENCSKKESK